jgi:hypothetical protein
MVLKTLKLTNQKTIYTEISKWLKDGITYLRLNLRKELKDLKRKLN